MASITKFGPLKLSELLKTENVGLDENAKLRSYYGVIVDAFSPDRIKSVREISFRAEMGEPGELSFDVMDTAIQYKQAQTTVFFEIPFDFGMDAKSILVLANSVGAGIILPPPETSTPENMDKWKQKCLEFAGALFAVPLYTHQVLPVTSYVEYMVMKEIGYSPDGLTDDVMMHQYFEKDMDTRVMDDLKKELGRVILEGLGGPTFFESMVQSTLYAMRENIVESAKSRIEMIKDIFAFGNENHVQHFLLNLLPPETENDVRTSIASTIFEHLKRQHVGKSSLSLEDFPINGLSAAERGAFDYIKKLLDTFEIGTTPVADLA